ncbi:DUF4232 domain-containing protein [Agromyces aurantiacus]|uniref:DUF4232 domain-containing protein n=1 Tax=Agromyces aurantiacus TaxID=165814 RepID=A0ABV9R265_9MICO|nr:DUF4232 domain-containing protein [Agromyces aurantiacus]MBM7505873.1 hypothetical protein [Agromyces aurantiacus]
MGGRHVGGASTTIALALVLTGCAGGGNAPVSPSPTPSPTQSASTSPTPTASGQVDPNAPAGQCADDALRVTFVDADGGAAGSTYSDLVFTNTGSDACELRGAPGVSVVDDSGVQLGEAAERQGDEDPPTLTLQPGGEVVAQLKAVNIDPGGGPLVDCPVVYGSAYLVYPPHSFTAVEVTTGDRVPACDSTTPFLTIGPVAED